MLLAALAGVLLLAAAAGGIAFAMRGGDDGSSGGATACERQSFPAQGQQHITSRNRPPKDFEYNSFPPTSGWHDPQPALWNVYDEPVPQRHLVHNLEHGGIVVQYGKDVPQQAVNDLIAWYREDPNGIVVAPLPDTPQTRRLTDKITVGAWVGRKTPITNETEEIDPEDEIPQEGQLMTCSGFDEEAFSDFRDDYRYRGPEPFAPEHLQPGMGM